ncbi:hypothetical protein ES705_19629 [subsurface metagenome]
MKKIILMGIFLFILCASLTLNAQWARTYGGIDFDRAFFIQQTSDGGYVAAGYTASSGAGISDFWVLKLSLAGVIEWQHTYGGSGDDVAYAVQETSDEGYIIAGNTYSFGAGGSDYWILKLTSVGDVEWQFTYGGIGDDTAYAIQETSDGGYIVAGYTHFFGAPISDIWILKLTSGGDIEWQHIYGGTGDDKAYSVQETSEGGYIVAGSIQYLGALDHDFWVLKLTSAGFFEWQRIYGGYGDDVANCIQETSDGGYVVTGNTYSFGAGDSDLLALKLSSAGDIEWQRTYGGSEEDVAYYIQETSDEGYVAAGYTDSFGAGESDFLLLKLFSDGDIDPSCELVGSSDATVQDTSSFVVYTYIPPQLTGAVPQSTEIFPQETSAASNLLCEARPTISGTAKTEGGIGLEGVTITFSDEEGTATTDSEGNYSHIVIEGWSGTATPFMTCYTFTPSSLTYTNVISDQSDQDYTGTMLTYTISGTISAAAPLSGVVMDGLPGSTTTDVSGYYEATVDCGWSGTVTPTMTRYVFSPSNRSYADLNSDQAGQDYEAYPGWIISGSVKTEADEGIGGVIITFSGVETTTTTSADGSYSHTVIEGWSGEATPSGVCYSFSPSSLSYSNLTSDQPNQDYTGTLIQYTLTINAGEGGTTQPLQGSYDYDCGTLVEITATPDSGYEFSDWSGDVPSGYENNNPLIITMNSDKSLTANFKKLSFWERLCFIATAAYDSPVHPHVGILRDFRDTYLLPSRLGRTLVNLYYKYSPSAAELITKNKALRIMVRINLLPFVALSYSMLHFGPVITAVMLLLIFLIPIFLIRFQRRKTTSIP